MKFNPNVHGCVVGNLKRSYKEKHLKDTTLNDHQIWRVYEHWFGVEDADGASQDELYVEEMKHLEEEGF